MKILEPNYYAQFQCAAGRCSDTCCNAWEVIVDKKTLALYRQMPGAFGDRVRRSLCRTDGAWMFRTQNGACPLLTKDRLCAIQKRCGHESLCATCREYPRFVSEFGLLQERGLSLSCPEVCRVLLTQTQPVTFVAYEDDTPLTGCHDIDAELFLHLKTARQTAIAVAQHRGWPVAERLACLLEYAQTLQRCIDCGNYGAMDAVTLNRPTLLAPKTHTALRTLQKWLHVLSTMEPLNRDWPQTLAAVAQATATWTPRQWLQARRVYGCQVDPIQEEQILVYYVYKFFLRSAYHADVLTQTRLIAFCCLMIDHLNFCAWKAEHTLPLEEQVAQTHRFARELEHSEPNLSALMRRINHTGSFAIARMHNLLAVAGSL